MGTFYFSLISRMSPLIQAYPNNRSTGSFDGDLLANRMKVDDRRFIQYLFTGIQKRAYPVNRQGLRIKESLHRIAATFSQELHLQLALNAFGYDEASIIAEQIDCFSPGSRTPSIKARSILIALIGRLVRLAMDE